MILVKNQKEKKKKDIKTYYIYSKIRYIALNYWSNPASNPGSNTNEIRKTGRSRYREKKRRGRGGRKSYYRDNSNTSNQKNTVKVTKKKEKYEFKKKYYNFFFTKAYIIRSGLIDR